MSNSDKYFPINDIQTDQEQRDDLPSSQNGVIEELEVESGEPIEETGTVQRKLKTRHLSMIALGGSIGTGLFMASGKAISTSGPGGALVAYVIVGIMVFFLMEGLGEMATYMPVSGSFSVFSAKFVDSALGFAIGWNEWFKHSITYAVDIKTAAVLMQFWFPKVDGWIFSLVAWLIIFTVNALSVQSFGEVEYWMSLVKIVTIIIFLIVGILRIFGVGGEAIYFHNFTVDEAPFVGGILGLFNVLIVAGFSFQGTELIGITAGESESPETNIPAAIKQVFWRILVFYICSIFVISLIIPYTDENLLRTDPKDIAVSPFTLVFQSIGIPGAKDIMNAVILTAILSAANSATYSSTRMLFSLSTNKKAPKLFQKLNSHGIPLYALIGTTCMSGIIYLLSYISSSAYGWLISASGLAGILNWFVISLSHFRFRNAFIKQGHDVSEKISFKIVSLWTDFFIMFLYCYYCRRRH